MNEFVLHHSVAVGWWLPYAAYADESWALFEKLTSGQVRAIVSADVATHVLASIEAIEREYADIGLNPRPPQITLGDIRVRFTLLRAVIREVHAGPAEIPLVWGIQVRFGIPGPDALLVWLAIREEAPLLVANYQLYQTLLPVTELFPEFRVLFLPDYEGA